MDYLKFLSNYAVLKRIVRDSSERTGPWRRYFFCGPLVNFVHKIKLDHKEEFEQCLDAEGIFLDRLRSGDLSVYNTQVVLHLHLENPGRVAASIAFVAWLLDQWDLQNQFSPDFSLDALCIPLWKLIRAEVCNRDLSAAARVFQEELEREGLIDPPETLAEESPERADNEEGDLHLAEPAVVQETGSEEEDEEMPPLEESEEESESLGEEELEEVETEGDSELEVVFASENEVLSPTPDLLRQGAASGLSSSSEEVCFSPLSGVAPLASSDSSCSEPEGEERVAPPSGGRAIRVSVIVHAPAQGTGGAQGQSLSGGRM
ncbi:E1B protein [Bat mastadenovirus WIV11]|uniref:E1B protein, small T-antigen n=1 Tax=Bat mastadenovirus WIV11 TaxID=1788433 RepID=A0A163HKI5_9ADEN|nr:E1B protein [Bat mastadenovirus WIV11]AMB43111.1 E1B protein [Bat mastadenovirus WIV11]